MVFGTRWVVVVQTSLAPWTFETRCVVVVQTSLVHWDGTFLANCKDWFVATDSKLVTVIRMIGYNSHHFTNFNGSLFASVGDFSSSKVGSILKEKICFRSYIIHYYLETRQRVIGKQCRPRSDASYQDLHCLLTGFSIKSRIKAPKKDPTPLK